MDIFDAAGGILPGRLSEKSLVISKVEDKEDRGRPRRYAPKPMDGSRAASPSASTEQENDHNQLLDIRI
jgi:hypothetical protein